MMFEILPAARPVLMINYCLLGSQFFVGILQKILRFLVSKFAFLSFNWSRRMLTKAVNFFAVQPRTFSLKSLAH
jgi:hypothetical protein